MARRLIKALCVGITVGVTTVAFANSAVIIDCRGWE